MKPPQFERFGSHSVTISPYRDQGIEEEVFLYFACEWRGAPVSCTMRADRYTHSSGLSEWRVYACEARDSERHDMTMTARQRLGDACRPMVLAWLDSSDYAVSERAAYTRAMRDMVLKARPYGDNPTREMRRSLATFRDKVTYAQAGYLTELADAFDRYASLYDAQDGALS